MPGCYNENMEQKYVERDQTLVFATTPGVRNYLAHLDEAAVQLQIYLSSLMDMQVRVIHGEHYEDILAGLEHGDIDFAKLGPYAFALAQARFGARALVNAVDASPDGTRPYPYRCIIFTYTDSGITHLSQLKNQRFGFVDRHSTTGYLMATFLLEQAGIDITRDLQPVFFYSHAAVAEAVSKKEVIAGAIMEEEYLRSTLEDGSAPFRLLAMSPLLSRGPIVIRPDLPRHIERKLLHVLEHIHESDLDCIQLLKLPAQRFVAAVQREKTLKTVAELAGVSYATVSRAINGRDRVAPATTARILKLVEELGYRPNANARSLHKARGDFVGILLPSLHYPGLDDIIDGIQALLNEVHMQLLICPISQSQEKALQRQKAYFEMFSNSRFEGVILTQWSTLDHTTLDLLVRNGLPYVLLEQDILEEGLRIAWQWLIAQGHQYIGLVTGATSLLEPTITRHTCMQFANSRLRVIEATATTADWQAILQEAHAPTALLCTDDHTAFCIRQVLSQRYPQLLIAGIGNSFLARQTALPSLAFDGAIRARCYAAFTQNAQPT